ncbi:MAG: hypothetical protein GXP62_18890 [Oligoflexia bacterium]|nr:hypothetical protein [Oligoflexia bacterium]
MYGFASQFILEAMSDDDEDGQSFYGKVPEYEKEKYLMLWLPGMDEPFKLIMPWGYGAFHNLGRLAAEVAQGKKGAGEAIGRMAAVAADNFNPMGTAPSLNQFLAPTLLDPIVQVMDNENFTGRPIAPPLNPFGPDEARHARSGRGTSEVAIGIARAINDLTGGDDVMPGGINLAGDHVEHLVEFLGGGLGREVVRAVKSARGLWDRDNFELEQVPFVRAVYGARTEFVDSENFYGDLDEIAYQAKYIKGAEESGDMARASELARRYAPTMGMAKRGKHVRKRASEIRSEAYKTSPPSKALLDEANVLMQHFHRDYVIQVGRVGRD